MTLAAVEASLAERGWAVIDLPNKDPVIHARDQILARLRQSLPDLAAIGDYHRHVAEEDRHVAIMLDAARMYWEARLGEAIVAANLDVLRRLAGPDLDIQRRPYLRAVRAHRPGDAAPLHRDTLYGASPHEISILVPFTDMPANGAMFVIPGSHLEPDSAYPYVQTASPDVTIGSPKHLLGYAYAPRLLSPSLQARAERVPLRVGQAMIFGLSLVHGGGVNAGEITRFSTDIRVVNPFVPVRRNRGVDAEYFVPLCRSPISRTAELYLAANTAAGGPTSEKGEA
jgi:hypothetical protein